MSYPQAVDVPDGGVPIATTFGHQARYPGALDQVGGQMHPGAAYAELERLLTRKEVAGLLRVDASTLSRWEQKGVGPRCVRLGEEADGKSGPARYHPADVVGYLNQRRSA